MKATPVLLAPSVVARTGFQGQPREGTAVGAAVRDLDG